MFAERFKKFSMDFKSRNSYTFPASTHFVDNDSSTTYISFGEQEMRNSWSSHVRRLGCRMTYVRSPEDGSMYVRDCSDPVADRRFIEIPGDVAIRMLALGHMP
jgi:hypothetical protein